MKISHNVVIGTGLLALAGLGVGLVAYLKQWDKTHGMMQAPYQSR